MVWKCLMKVSVPKLFNKCTIFVYWQCGDVDFCYYFVKKNILNENILMFFTENETDELLEDYNYL